MRRMYGRVSALMLTALTMSLLLALTGCKAAIEVPTEDPYLASLSEQSSAKTTTTLSINRVGDTVIFGQYEDRPLEWRVLAIEDEKALLIVNTYITALPYNTEKRDVTWESCTLRSWLNNDFYGCFSEDQKQAICTTINETSESIDAQGGVQTRDKVFLLSVSEATQYFTGDVDRYSGYPILFVDPFESWWLRSSGSDADTAALVDACGVIFSSWAGQEVNKINGVRAAMWVDLSGDKESIVDRTSNGSEVGATNTDEQPLDGYYGPSPSEEGWHTLQGDANQLRTAIANDDAPWRIVSSNGYIWRVLKFNEEKALLLSDDIIEYAPYNDVPTSVTWEKCSLRQWLNDDFLNGAFSDEERVAIADMPVLNADNSTFGTSGGEDTTDKVFLLSLDEAKRYDRYRIANLRLTEHQINRIVNEVDGMNYKMLTNGSPESWWLRSPGEDAQAAALVLYDGSIMAGDTAYVDDLIEMSGCSVKHSYGVRPALWLDLTAL